MRVRRLEEHTPSESLVPRRRLDQAPRTLQRAVNDMRVADREDRAACRRAEAAHRRRLVLRERADGQRRALDELAEAAAQDGAAFRQHAHRHAQPRRHVDPLGQRFAIGAEAQFETHPVVDAPAVLSERRQLGAVDILLRRRPDDTWCARRAIRPDGRHRARWLTLSPSKLERCMSTPILKTCCPHRQRSWAIVSAPTICRLWTSRV